MAQDPIIGAVEAVHRPHARDAARRGRYKYEVANSGFEAAFRRELPPDTIVIDLAMGRSESPADRPEPPPHPQYEQTMIIALPGDGAPRNACQLRLQRIVQEPFDVALLAERIQTLVEEKRENS